MGSTLSTFDGLLKEYYKPNIVEKLVFPNNVLLGMLEQDGDTKMVGDVMPVPVIYGNPQGGGYTFSTAQTNNSNLRTTKFNIEAGQWHAVVEIGDKAIEASRTNLGAFLENKKAEIDGLHVTAGDALSAYTWGNGGQSLGVVGTVSTTLLTLQTASDITNFERDMVLVASANDGSDASHTLRTGNELITGIDRGNGTLTAVDWTTISSITAGDHLFRQSDFFGDQGSVVIKGVQAFVANTDTPAALWGVTAATRLTDLQRLSGCRVPGADIAGLPLDERIMKLLSYMQGRFKVAAMPDAGFLHPEDFQTLVTLMSARGVRPLEDKETRFGYMKIGIWSPAGEIPIYTDRHCPKGHFFALRMKDWWMSSLGELVHPQTSDGLQMLRRDTSTDVEFRLISYPALACRAPGNNGRVPL